MVGNLSQISIGLADTWFLGQLEGHGPLASMGQAGVVYLVIFLVFSSAFMGIQALAARRFGQNDDRGCGLIFNNGLLLQLVIGLTVGVAGITIIDDLVRFVFSQNEAVSAVLPLTTRYLEIRVGGFVTVTTLWAFRGFFYGIGITRPDIWAGLGMNVLNIIFNYALVLGNWGFPKMGVAGAAWSSVSAQLIVALGMMALAMKKQYRKKYGLFRLEGISRKVIAGIMKLSAPRALQALAFGGSVYFFKVISDECGETALASSIIVWRIFGILVMAGLAYGAAAGTLVSQSLGEKRPDLAESYGWAASRLGFWSSACLAVVGFIFPGEIIGAFSDDPEVVKLGIVPMRLVLIFGCLDSVGIILARALSAAGASLYVMWAEICVSIGCVVPFLILVQHFLPGNLDAIWGAWIVYMVTWFAFMTLKFRGGTWKTIEI